MKRQSLWDLERYGDVTTVILAAVLLALQLGRQSDLKMPDYLSRPSILAVITFGIFCAAVLCGSGLRLTEGLEGGRGSVFVLLILAAPVLIAAGAAGILWRLMATFLPHVLGVPERMLFAFATFVTFCGSGPFAISLAIMEITRRDGTVGASSILALTSLVAGAFLAVYGLAIAAMRFVLRRPANDGR